MNYYYCVNKEGTVKSVVVPKNLKTPEEMLQDINRVTKEDFIYGANKLEQIIAYDDMSACSAYFPKDFDKQKILEILNKKENENYTKIITVGPNEHVCPYCGMLAQGPDKNLLCKECRTDFGHSTIDEL